jgi:ParB family chromosome partitioning protein
LGRGLEALLGRPPEGYADSQPAEAWPADATAGSLVYINIQQIDANPFQPRRDFNEDDIASLAGSIKEHGLIQPICVRRSGDRYQVVAGERRLRAAGKAGWSEVPAQIIEADDRQTAELAIVENLQRKDLNPLEKAASFQEYLGRYQCTHEDLAGRLHIDRSTVSNLIRLLELPEAVQHAVRSGTISQGHARALLPLGEEHEQVAMCQRISSEGLSVRTVESMVQEAVRHADGEPLAVISADGDRTAAPRTRSEHLASLEQELRNALGTKVDVRQTAKGSGRMVIHFSSHDEFERLRGHLCGHQQPHLHQQAG